MQECGVRGDDVNFFSKAVPDVSTGSHTFSARGGIEKSYNSNCKINDAGMKIATFWLKKHLSTLKCVCENVHV